MILTAMWGLPGYFGHAAHAADAAGAHSECVNPLNTAWTLSAAFLVRPSPGPDARSGSAPACWALTSILV